MVSTTEVNRIGSTSKFGIPRCQVKYQARHESNAVAVITRPMSIPATCKSVIDELCRLATTIIGMPAPRYYLSGLIPADNLLESGRKRGKAAIKTA